MNTVLSEYEALVCELSRKVAFARAENEALRERLAEALNGEAEGEADE